MEYGVFPQEKWDAFRDVEGVAHSIRLRVEKVVELLSAASASVTILGRGAVRVLPSGGDSVANIQTPVGSGRIVLAWELNDKELEGVMVVERKRCDSHGNDIWESVWRIRVPRLKCPYYGQNDNRREIDCSVQYDNTMPNHPVFAALMSILYGITNGPVKP